MKQEPIINYFSGEGFENIVDLETAKYLKGVGFNHPTHWYWIDKDLKFIDKGLNRVKIDQRRMNHNKYDEWVYSAPSREEVMKYLLFIINNRDRIK